MSFTNIYFENNNNNNNSNNNNNNSINDESIEEQDEEEEEYCPSERMGHICQVYAGKFIIIWGGHRYDDSRNETTIKSSLIWVFNAEIEKWKSIKCKDSPPLLSGSCSILVEDSIYLFGGCKRAVYGSFGDIHHNELYRLCLKNLTWETCPVKNGKYPSPRGILKKLFSLNKIKLKYFFNNR